MPDTSISSNGPKEDQWFVGHCPGMIALYCQGDDEPVVYRELCEIIDEWIEAIQTSGKPLPEPKIGHFVVNRVK